MEKASCRRSRSVCVHVWRRKEGKREEEGEAGILLFQTLSLESCCGNCVCATFVSVNLSAHYQSHTLNTHTHTQVHNKYHGWELGYVCIYLNILYEFNIYFFYPSISETTAGSKAYDSGKWQPRLFCYKERQIKAKRGRQRERATNHLFDSNF